MSSLMTLLIIFPDGPAPSTTDCLNVNIESLIESSTLPKRLPSPP